MTAEVLALSAGRFQYDGPMLSGLEGNMGPSALIRQDGVYVVLVTIREQPFDTAFSRTLGLDPKKMRVIGVKSAAHFRAAFEPWAGQVYVVAEPGLHNPENLRFHRLGRKLYPLDPL
jgi:microcystin degradation protein MlrC